MSAMVSLPGYRRLRGFVWPCYDQRDMPKLFDQSDAVDIATGLCRDRRVAVQAGGHCGVWPSMLAERFGTVYTFEPDRMNFTALVANTVGHDNVVAFNAALGKEPGPVGMANDEVNCASAYLMGDGVVPVLRVDDLALPFCELLYLDIEGFEMMALHGARKTIERCRPVIGFENKKLGERYGIDRQRPVRWLRGMGYDIAERPHKDIVMVPR